MPQEMTKATIQDVRTHPETGWTKIKTDKGTFDTKIPEKAQEAFALIGHSVRLFYTPGPPSRNTNPHTGQRYPDTQYYERAEVIFDGNAPAVPQAKPQPAGGSNRDEVWRICLSVGVKAAIATLPLMPNEQRDFPTQQQIATAWAKFLFFSTPPDLGASTPQTLHSPPDPEQAFRPLPPVQAAQRAWEKRQHPGAYDEPDYGPPGPPDGDIPF